MNPGQNDSRSRYGAAAAISPPGGIIRLMVIPLLVYLIWTLGTFLLAGLPRLFRQPEPVALGLYTVLTCLAAGIILPLILLRRAFVSGTVNMFQLGFRSLHRTIVAVLVTLLVVAAVTLLANPYGADRPAFAAAFLLFLPTGMASVMVCWVLAGTHVQALVRGGGVAVSISVGVVVTAMLFGLTTLAQFPGAGPDSLFWSLAAGLLAAVFFFSVRDIWASSFMVTACLVYLSAGHTSATALREAIPAVAVAAVLILGLLAAIHGYLSRHYITLPLPGA